MAATVWIAPAAALENRAWSNSGRAAKAPCSDSGTVQVTKKYGTGSSRETCCCVQVAVFPPPQRGQARWWQEW